MRLVDLDRRREGVTPDSEDLERCDSGVRRVHGPPERGLDPGQVVDGDRRLRARPLEREAAVPMPGAEHGRKPRVRRPVSEREPEELDLPLPADVHFGGTRGDERDARRLREAGVSAVDSE